MDSTKQSIKVDFNDWKIRVDERSKGRMKLQIKLSKDEAIAFKNFAEVCKPEEVSDDQFIKTIFVTGYETLNKQLTEMIQQYALENKEELETSGITVFEGDDGQVTIGPSKNSETISEEEE